MLSDPECQYLLELVRLLKCLHTENMTYVTYVVLWRCDGKEVLPDMSLLKSLSLNNQIGDNDGFCGVVILISSKWFQSVVRITTRYSLIVFLPPKTGGFPVEEKDLSYDHLFGELSLILENEILFVYGGFNQHMERYGSLIMFTLIRVLVIISQIYVQPLIQQSPVYIRKDQDTQVISYKSGSSYIQLD